jgi:hypothetical protein
MWTSYRFIASDIYRGVNVELMDTVLLFNEDPEAFKQQSLTNDMYMVSVLRERRAEFYAIEVVSEREAFVVTLILEEGVDYGLYPDVAARRIVEKFILIGERDAVVPIAIVLASGLLGFFLPNFKTKLKHLLNKGVIIYDEVIGYHTVVILLIHHSQANIYMLLQWLTSFASVFKHRFQACIDHLNADSIKSLTEEIDNVDLQRLIDCTALAYDGAALDIAFAGVEQRYKFQEDARRDMNELVVKKRVMYSQALSWAALGVAFGAYILAPMIIAIVEMLFQVVAL